MTNRQRKRMKRTGSKMSKREIERRGRQAYRNERTLDSMHFDLLTVSDWIRIYAFGPMLKPWSPRGRYPYCD
jgi:hypothetical protein